MAFTMDLKLVLKYLGNGTLGENLCIICLSRLNNNYENIFTKVCKEGNDFSVADVLDSICQIKVSSCYLNFKPHNRAMQLKKHQPSCDKHKLRLCFDKYLINQH